MELILFIIFLSLSLCLIFLGLFKPEHSELALVGFGFLFIMSLVIINGDIQYKTGEHELYIYGINLTEEGLHWIHGGSPPPPNNEIFLLHMNESNIYTSIQDFSIAGNFFLHLIGYWLAICSIIGFIGVLAGIRGNIKK